MTARVIVYRACDRPQYVEHTWPRLVEASSSPIVAVENSAAPENTERNLVTLWSHPSDGMLVHVEGRALGITAPISAGLRAHSERTGHSPEYLLVTDDDILLPDGWDVALVGMIESGAWDVVGIPRAARVTGDLSGEGSAAGYPVRFMAAGGCAFRTELLDRYWLAPDAAQGTFNAWSGHFRCAWHPYLVKQEIDKYDDPGLGISRKRRRRRR